MTVFYKTAQTQKLQKQRFRKNNVHFFLVNVDQFPLHIAQKAIYNFWRISSVAYTNIFWMCENSKCLIW